MSNQLPAGLAQHTKFHVNLNESAGRRSSSSPQRALKPAPVARRFRRARPTLPRARGGGLRALGAAFLACAVLLTGLLAAGSATAQDITTPTANEDGSDTLWTATLTVEEFPSSGTFSSFGYDDANSEGSLSSDTFTIGGTNYPVWKLYMDKDSRGTRLEFWQATVGFPAERSDWVLYLGETAFHVSDADSSSIGKIEWSNPGLNWADDDEVAVRLVRLNAPTAPRSLTASAASSARIELSWTAPSKTGGSDITGYKIEVSTDGGNDWTDLVADTGSTDTTYSHKRLASRSTYHYQVSAINDIDTGPVSNTASATTAQDITTPTANEDGSDTLWTATLTVEEFPSSGTFSSFGYDDANSEGSLSSDTFTIGGTNYPVWKLYMNNDSRGTRLEFWQATVGFPAERSDWVLYLGETAFHVSDADSSSTGKIEWSNPGLNWANNDEVEVRLVRLNAPPAPTDLTAAGASETQIDLSWTPPSKNGGSDITGYKIEVSTDNGNNWTDLVADTSSTETEYSDTRLTTGDTYHYRVSAINDIGTGAVSDEASAIAAVAPGAPRALAGVPASETQIDLSWLAPEKAGGSDITGYKIEVSPNGRNNWSVLVADTNSLDTEYSHTGLPAGATRHYRVSAINDVGTGPVSNTALAIADTTPPTVTTAATVSATNYNKIELRFSEAMDSTGQLQQGAMHAFSFTIGGESQAPLRVWLSGDKLKVHFTRAIFSGQTITVNYDPDRAQRPAEDRIYAGDNALRDRAGNRLAAFSNLSVTNNSSLAKPQLKLELVGSTKTIKGGGSVTYRIRAMGSSAIWGNNNGISSQACLDLHYRLDWTTPWPSHTPGRDIGRRNDCLSAQSKDGNNYWEYTMHLSSQDDRPMHFKPKLLAGSQYTMHSERSLKIAVNPQIEVKDAEASEGTNANLRFEVQLRPAPVESMTVDYATSDGTATAGSDYTATSGTLTFSAGQKVKYIQVPITNDTVADSGETVTLTLSNPSGVMRLVTTRSRCVEKVAGDGTCIDWIPTVFASTVTATGTILNDEPGPNPAVEDLPLVTIRATSAYPTEGSDAVFKLTRTGDSSDALTVPVSVQESGAMLDASAPTSATFAEGDFETELRVSTVADEAAEEDSTVTVSIEAGSAYRLGANDSSEVMVTVLDDDAPPLPDGTPAIAADVIWSADMTVKDYQNGSIGAGSADLLANQGGSAGLQAKWLYYHKGDRKLLMKFTTNADIGGEATLYAGDVELAFRGEGDSSFSWENVDVDWTDGQTFEASLVQEGSVATPAPDPTLKSLAVSDAAVSPAFDSRTLFYTAVVDSATASVTMSAESNDDDAEVAFAPSEDADSGQAGHQVAVPAGETLITATVTAADGQTQRAYRVLVKRPPTVAVSFGSASYTATEGGAKASVIIELSADPGRDVTIPLTASPAGGAAAEDYTVPGSVTFTSGGALSQGVVLTAVADDTAEAGESVVLGFGDLPDGVEAGATTSAAVTLADADAAVEAVNMEPTGLPTISGTPQVGETLTASVTGITDTDGTESATFAYQWVSNNGTSDSDIEDATKSSYELLDADAGKTIKVRVTFTDDGGTEETLASAATDAVAAAIEAPETDPLTASFSSVPAEHDGETAFGFRVEFSEDVGISYIMLRDESFSVTEGDVTGARRVNGRHDLWEITVEPDSREAMTISLAAGRDCGTDGAVCTSGDDPRALSNSPSATVAGPPNDPLTASFSGMPAEHAGAGTFKFGVTFSEEPAVGYQKLRDDAFIVSGGEVKTARRQQQGSNLAWDITVKPDPAAGAVTIELPETTDCNADGAICTSDERPLSHSLSATVAGPVGISVADARAQEGAGNTVDFTVTLSRASSGTVTVGYATADGTATAGQDYTAASGTLTFAPGETSGSVPVSVLDDTHDDDGETFTLRLSNASGGRLTDDSATGTIENSDPMPQAWLARFGRAASDHVVQAIGTRLRGGSPETPETHFTLGGRQADSLFSPWDGIRAAFAPTATDTGKPALADASSRARMDRLGAESLAGGSLGGSSFGGGSLAGSSPAGGNLAGGGLAGPAGGGTSGSQAARSMLMNGLGLPTGNLRDLLMGSSFFYSRPVGEDDPSDAPGWLGQWSAWGETAATRFSGADGRLSLNGEVATAILGADSRWGRWLAGVTLSHSLGEGEYTHIGALGGAVTSTLTSVNPYAHYQLSDRVSVWGVLGYGVGGLTLTPERAETGIRTDLTTTMAAFGGRGVLSGRSGRFQLAFVSDALVTNTASESVENLVGAKGATSRLRLLLEGSGSMPLATGGVLRPTLEAGLRYDGGDAETGAGIEIGGGLAYAAGRLAVEVKGRVLLAHEDKKYEESGYSASIAYTPSEDGRGLSMRLGSAWGATQSGVQSLWSSQDASGLTRGAAMDLAQRFQAELGYGLSGRGKADTLWIPFVGAEAAGGGQALRMGLRLTSGPNREMGLELGRRKGARDAGQGSGPGAQHAVELRGRMRW